MASTVRDIIVEAAARANVCPRKRALPEDIFVSGLNLFNGVMQEYSTDGYIEAYKSEVDFNPGKDSVYVGVGDDADVSAPGIQLPKKALYKYAGAVDWTELEFIAYDQFYSSAYTDYVVSWQPVGPNLYKMYFKPRFISSNPQVKLIYNLEMQFNDNDTVNLPTPYVELVTRALTYKIAVKYPRVDDAARARLKTEQEELEKSLTAVNASQRIITRDVNANGGSLNAWFRSGGFVSSRFM